MGVFTMYTRGMKPCTRRLQEFYSQGLLPSCYPSIAGLYSSSLAEAPIFPGWLHSHAGRNSLRATNLVGGIRRSKYVCKVPLFQRLESTSLASCIWPSCRGVDMSSNIHSKAFLSRHLRSLPGHTRENHFTLATDLPKSYMRQGLIFSKESLLRMSVSSSRCISEERDTDDKNQVAISPLVGGGGDSDKGAEHVLASDGGSEEDENNEEHRQWQSVAPGNGQDELVEKERTLEGKEDVVFMAQKAKFKKVFEESLLNGEGLQITMEGFPYYLSDTTRDLLVDCAAAHLRQPKYAEYGSGLPSSSRRICLHGPAGTQLHQERLVEALAHHLKASLLILDSTILAPHDFGTHEVSTTTNLDEEESEANNEVWESSDTASELSDDEEESTGDKMRGGRDFKVDVLLEMAADTVEAHRQQVFLQERTGQGDAEEDEHGKSAGWKVKKGDRVKYVGSGFKITTIDDLRQWLRVGQRGCLISVPKVYHGKLGVRFDKPVQEPDGYTKASSGLEELQRTEIEWCHLSDLAPDDTPPADPAEEWLAAVDSLCEMTSPTRPLVVYFPDPRQWFERAVPLERRQEFLERVEAKFDEIEGPVVLICSRTAEEEADLDDRARLKAHLEDIRVRLNQRTSTKWIFRELLGSEDVYWLFTNPIKINPPEEDEKLREWKKQLLHDKEITHAKQNLQQLRQILETHNMECEELLEVKVLGLHLTKSKAERVVGWARNHHLGLCLFDPPTNNGKLMIPRDSMERALTRLRDQETKKAPNVVKDFKTVAEDEYEKALISAVIPPNEVGVKFDHIGALENVKNALKELVMLPLQRPELFSKGNLTRPCKGVLLFGPPGTGKTLLAKAVATEAGANFINITGSTITSKWFGDAEKLTKALFSLARKLSPAVIFVDEVDSLLGARGGSSEHEATRKTRNEFMAAWDGLRSKDSERVLVLAATNRPFDLDDAVIRRLPRRILVDLPTTENRAKILRVILAEEELAEGFDYEELSRMTDGYSGSDLKNLSIAAAYRPIRELLEFEETQAKVVVSGSMSSCRQSTSLIRPLRLDDFKQAMTQVGASVAFDASSMNELRRWNEQYGEGGNRRKSNFGFVV